MRRSVLPAHARLFLPLLRFCATASAAPLNSWTPSSAADTIFALSSGAGKAGASEGRFVNCTAFRKYRSEFLKDDNNEDDVFLQRDPVTAQEDPLIERGAIELPDEGQRGESDDEDMDDARRELLNESSLSVARGGIRRKVKTSGFDYKFNKQKLDKINSRKRQNQAAEYFGSALTANGYRFHGTEEM